ncbi:MAG: hypothetical protein ACON4H_07675 [Rubripirellula sp.]
MKPTAQTDKKWVETDENGGNPAVKPRADSNKHTSYNRYKQDI